MCVCAVFLFSYMLHILCTVLPSSYSLLDKRHVVSLEQYLSCCNVSQMHELLFPVSVLYVCSVVEFSFVPRDRLFSSGFVLVTCLTSTASSMTRFMNSSKPWIVTWYHQYVYSKSLFFFFLAELDRQPSDSLDIAYPDFPLDADG